MPHNLLEENFSQKYILFKCSQKIASGNAFKTVARFSQSSACQIWQI